MHAITLLEKKDVAHNTPMYTFSKPEGFSFQAGQYVSMKVAPTPYSDEKGNFRSFSIASAPHQDTLDFVMRRSESAFKKNLDQLPIGGVVEITNAVGTCILPFTGTEQTFIFLTGGVGITPIRSILLDAIEQKRQEKFFLFYSNWTPNDAPLFTEINSLSGVQLEKIHTMTCENPDELGWHGECGFINIRMIQKHVPDFQSALFYVVGTAQFIETMKEMLFQNGIDSNRILADNFGSATNK